MGGWITGRVDISDVVGLMQQNATVWPGGIVTTFLLTCRRE
jgi:hypothetical protein